MYPLELFICTLLPSVLARGGAAEGAGAVADGISSATSDLTLEPLLAATFAFYVIFAVFGAYQAFQAVMNISGRLSEEPSAITLPEYSVGPVFPISLLLSTLTFTTFNILISIEIGLIDNENVLPSDRPTLPPSFLTAASVMGYLINPFLISSAFAILAQREKVLVETSRVVRGIKIIFDVLLTAALFALGMWWVGTIAVPEGERALRVAEKVLSALIYLTLIATVDIAISSIVLYIRAKHNTMNDHKITFLMTVVVSPFLVLYALYPVILRSTQISPLYREQLGLADAIVNCIFPFIIVWTYLNFGMPPVPKEKKGS